MKKTILALALLASLFCSCNKQSILTPSRQESLKYYACGLFSDVVAYPAVAMDLAYELNTFLKLSNEERKSHRLANTVLLYDKNKYAILLYNGASSLIINTNGTDLCTGGAKWDIYYEIQALSNFLSKEDILCNNSSSSTSLSLECTLPGHWGIKGFGRNGTCSATLGNDDLAEREWLMNCEGDETDKSATGIVSTYLSYNMLQESDCFKVTLEKNMLDGNTFDYIFEGTFLVNIFSFNEIKERAFVVGMPGFILNCITETEK